MGAGRRSVCFESEETALLLPVSVQTKNTFVHFEARDTRARRGTCTGGLLALRRGSWNEADLGARRCAPRGVRAATCQPNLVAAVRIPELRRGSVESVESVESEWSCPSPKSPLCICLETPTVLFVPSPRNVQPMTQGFAVQGYTQGFFQGCATPVACATPVNVVCSPMSTPRGSPCGHSPMSTPRGAPSQGAAAGFGVWQPLQEAKKSRRSKAVLPALDHEVTLMLRHLPLALSPAALFAELEEFRPFVDFYYLPTNFETKKNLGYAFLNFTDRHAARRFATFWEQSGIPESGDVPVQDARVQGFAENVERFRNSSVMAVLAADLMPRIFSRGIQLPFPRADKALPPVGPRFRPTGQ